MATNHDYRVSSTKIFKKKSPSLIKGSNVVSGRRLSTVQKPHELTSPVVDEIFIIYLERVFKGFVT